MPASPSLYNRCDHAIIGDSVKGAKPTDKGWTSLVGPLTQAGWANIWDGVVGGAKLSGLTDQLNAYVEEYGLGPRRDGTTVLGSSHHVCNFAWTMSCAFETDGRPRGCLTADQERLLRQVFQQSAYIPGFFMELGGSAKAWYTSKQFAKLIEKVRELSVPYKVPIITSADYCENMMAQFPFRL